MGIRRLASMILLGTVPFGLAASAAAQDAGACEEPPGRGPLRFTPSVGAHDVTLNAWVKVEYPDGYFEDPMIGADPEASIVLREEATREKVPGDVRVLGGDTLFFLPAGQLQENTEYEGRAFGFDFDKPFRFETGDSLDTEPPELGEINGVSTSRVESRCDAPGGGYRVDVSFPPATDDGPSGSVEYMLYLTRGEKVDSPERVATQRNFSTDLVTMAFVLSPEEAVSPACVVVHAVDGVGRTDSDGKAQCFEPVQGKFFEPLCSLPTAAGGGGPVGAGVMVGLAVVALAVRRRRV